MSNNSNPAPLIIIAGNLGVGKTSLAHQLCAARPDFRPYWEQPEQRPFQPLLATTPTRWACTNQIDFLTYRAQQEYKARWPSTTPTKPALFDGGLDQDYHVFTRYLHHLNHLTDNEYALCTQTYALCRQLLPQPNLIIYLTAPPALLAQRRATRNRALDTTITPDHRLPLFETYLDDWLTTTPIPTYHLDANTTTDITPLLTYLKQQFP